MTLFGHIDLGIDDNTGLNKQLQVWQINIDGKSEVVTVVYDIVLLSPTNKVIQTLSTDNFKRFDRLAQLDEDNNVLMEASLKWTYLKESPLGKGILGMIALDLSKYPDFEQK